MRTKPYIGASRKQARPTHLERAGEAIPVVSVQGVCPGRISRRQDLGTAVGRTSTSRTYGDSVVESLAYRVKLGAYQSILGQRCRCTSTARIFDKEDRAHCFRQSTTPNAIPVTRRASLPTGGGYSRLTATRHTCNAPFQSPRSWNGSNSVATCCATARFCSQGTRKKEGARIRGCEKTRQTTRRFEARFFVCDSSGADTITSYNGSILDVGSSL